MARLRSVVLGTPDPRGLAAFYRGLLEEWSVVDDEPDWVKITPPDGGTGLSFQLETGHVAPVWPPREGAQQMQVHLDIAVADLPAGIARAAELGAVEPPVQPQVVCTRSRGSVDCWRELPPYATPAHRGVADGPATLTAEQEAHRTRRWPQSLNLF